MRQSLLSRVNRDLSGATAIEYALLAGLVGVAAIGALAGLGKSLDNNFDGVQSSFDQATRSARVGSDDAPDTPSGEPGPNAPIAPDAASVEDPGVADAEEEATERIPDHDTPDPVSPRDAMPNLPRRRIPSDQRIPPPHQTAAAIPIARRGPRPAPWIPCRTGPARPDRPAAARETAPRRRLWLPARLRRLWKSSVWPRWRRRRNGPKRRPRPQMRRGRRRPRRTRRRRKRNRRRTSENGSVVRHRDFQRYRAEKRRVVGRTPSDHHGRISEPSGSLVYCLFPS